MKDYSSAIIHFIKLIDATNTSIRKYKSSTFKNNFSGFWILCDVNSETYGGGALA